MALTGKLGADFSSFSAAVQTVQVQLRGFEDNAGKVGKALSTMTDNFKGTKLISDATLMARAVELAGGVATLTGSQLEALGAKAQEASEKLRLLGKDVPKNLQDIADAAKRTQDAFGQLDIAGAIEHPIDAATTAIKGFLESIGPVGQVTLIAAAALTAEAALIADFATKAADAGEKIQHLSDKTGIAVPALSRMGQAATIAGGDLEQIGNAIFMFDKQLADSPAKVEAGLTKLGLSFDAIKALKPEDQFNTIAAAMASMSDTQARNAAGAELFGRQARDLMPLILNLGSAMEKTSGLSVFTPEQAKQAEEFNQDLRALQLAAQDVAITIGKDLIPILKDLADFAVANKGGLIAGIVGGVENEIRLREINVLLAAMKGLLSDITTLPPVKPPPAFAAPAPVAAGFAEGNAAMTAQTTAAAILDNHLTQLRDHTIDLTAAQRTQAAAMLAGGDSAAYTARLMREAAGGMGVSEQSVKNLEKALNTAKEQAKQFATAQANLSDIINNQNWDGTVAGMLKLGGSAHDTAIYMGENEGAVKRLATSLAEGKRILDQFTGAQERLENILTNTDWDGTIEGMIRLGGATKDIAIYMGETEGAIKGVATQVKFLQSVTDATAKAFKDQHAIMGLMAPRYTTLSDAITGIDHVTGNLASQELPAATGALVDLGSGVTRLNEQLKESRAAAEAFKIGIADAFADFPATLARAFEGGGNLTGAFDSLGAQIGGVFSKKVGATIQLGLIKDVDGNTIGQSWSGALASGLLSGGIGAGIGLAISTIGKLLAKIGGPSADQLAARSTFAAQFKSVQDAIDQIGPAYAAMGKDGVEAQQDIQRALDATHVSAAAEAAALQIINDKLAAGKLFAQNVATALSGVVSAGKNLAGGLTANIQASIRALLTMKGVTADATAALQALLDSSQANFDQLDQIAAKYGADLAGLGPQFAQGDLNNQAAKLYDDFQQLVDGGADVGGTLDLMKAKWADFAASALKSGSTVPEALRPILQNLADAGDLVDENGNKLTDLSKFKFANTPLATGIDTLAKAIDHLSEVLGGVPGQFDKIGAAINNLPPVPGLPTSGTEPVTAPVGYGARGGLMHQGVIYAFQGFVPRGLDRHPAMIADGESILTRKATAILGSSAISALNQGQWPGGGGGTGDIHTHVYLNGREIATAVSDQQAQDYRRRYKVRAA